MDAPDASIRILSQRPCTTLRDVNAHPGLSTCTRVSLPSRCTHTTPNPPTYPQAEYVSPKTPTEMIKEARELFMCGSSILIRPIVKWGDKVSQDCTWP